MDDDLISLKARGSDPATSPNPPTLIKGSASEAINSTFILEGLVIILLGMVIFYTI
jgi:hypothetical protein